MCPTYTFIDRADGKFNRAMGFEKDYSALVSAAWDIDNYFDEYLNSPDADSYEKLSNLGILPMEDGPATEKVLDGFEKGTIRGPFAERFVSKP